MIEQLTRYSAIKSIEQWSSLLIEGEEVFVSEQIDGEERRMGMVQGELFAGSETSVYECPEPDHFIGDPYYAPFLIHPVRSLIETLGKIYDQVVLFGVLYDSYGIGPRIGFSAIDLSLEGQYLDWPVFHSICKKHLVETAPLVAHVPYCLSTIQSLSTGRTLLSTRYPYTRKGIILHPIHERVDTEGNRVILKSRNPFWAKKRRCQ